MYIHLYIYRINENYFEPPSGVLWLPVVSMFVQYVMGSGPGRVKYKTI